MRRIHSMQHSMTENSPSQKQAAPQSKTRRFSRTTLLLCGLLVLLSFIFYAPSAWRETTRREAYLPQLESWARRDASNSRLLALMGGRQVQAGEYPAAADTLRRALAAGEQNEDVWLNLAAATAAAGNRALAVADLRLGMRSLPHNAPGLLRALDQVQALKPEASPLLMARAICPSGPDALLAAYAAGSVFNGLVEAWNRTHLETSGFATRSRLAAEKPDDAQAQRLWGLALMRNRRLPEAGAALQRAVTLAPRSPLVLLALADWLDATGSGTQATITYLDCLELRPNWLPALLGVGKTSLDTGLNQFALDAYEKAARTDPKSVDAWIGLGRVHRGTGVEFAKAIEAFQTAARLAPERTDYYDDYADALRKAVQWPLAEDILRKRLKTASNDPFAHYLLGMVLLNNAPTLERQIEAENETRETLRLFPHNSLADIQLAQIALGKKQLPEAIGLLNDALQQNPYNRNAMTVLARAYRQAGRTDLSEQESRQADLLFKDQQRIQVLEGDESKRLMDAGIHEELARLYGRIGQSKKASYEQSMAQLLHDDPAKVAAALEKFRAMRSKALPSN